MVGGAYTDQVLNANERDEVEKQKAIFKSIFTQLMSSTKEVISEAIAKLITRLNLKNKVHLSLICLMQNLAVYRECSVICQILYSSLFPILHFSPLSTVFSFLSVNYKGRANYAARKAVSR